MSLTSKSRKESTESHAARRSHNTMGMAPGMIQLSDFDIRDQQTSNRIETNTPNVPEDTLNAQAEASTADNDMSMHDMDHDVDMDNSSDLDNSRNMNRRDMDESMERMDIEESRRASWGQPSMEEDEMVTDEDVPRVAYRNQDQDMGAERMDDADWNTSTDSDEDMSTRPRGMGPM